MAAELRLIWSPEAIGDLTDIWNYYAEVASRLTADTIIRKIGNAVRLLEDHPHGGRGAMRYDADSGHLAPIRT